MKWQLSVCGSRAWQASNCFEEVVGSEAAKGAAAGNTRDNLVEQYRIALHDALRQELDVLETCYASATTTNTHRLLFDCHQFPTAHITPVDQWLHIENEHHLARGIYADQLLNWLRFYPSDRMLVVSSEELDGDAVRGMRLVMDFLGVDSRRMDARVSGDVMGCRRAKVRRKSSIYS